MLLKKTTCLLWALSIAVAIAIPKQSAAQSRSTGQASDQPKNGYVSLAGQIAIPQADFKKYSKVRGGFRIEGGKYFSDHSPFSFGGEMSLLLSSAKNDQFKGLDIKTSTLLFDLQPFLRWSPRSGSTVRPYFDLSSGMALTNTQTTSEIVDRPTFLEEFLLGADEEVETTTHKYSTSVNLSYSAGAGLYISKYVIVGARYQLVRPVRYVDKNEVFVQNGDLMYPEHKIPLDMWIVTLGITF